MHPSLQRRIGLLSAVAMLAVAVACGRTAAADEAWFSYVGANRQAADWAGFVRGVGRDEAGDWRAALAGRSASNFDRVLPELSSLAREKDLILPVGGLLSAHQPDEARAYLQALESDQGRSWRRAVREQAARAAKAADPDRVYWQIGNEINSRHYAKAFGVLGPLARPDDKAIIPLYAERYFAPSVAGILDASRDVYGDERRIKIVLGSIAGAYRPASRGWLEELLSYRLRGDYAPELAGRSVFELIDVVAIHYLLTQGDASWEAELSELRTRWIGRGRVGGVWATEEIGLKLAEQGLGGAGAVKATSRCLGYALANGLAPRQFRCGLWGWWIGETGMRGQDAMALLHDFLGSAPLRRGASVLSIDGDDRLEWRAFEDLSSPPRYLVAAFPKARGGHGELRWTIDKAEKRRLQFAIHLFDRDGLHSRSLAMSNPASAEAEPRGDALAIPPDGAVLILVEPVKQAATEQPEKRS